MERLTEIRQKLLKGDQPRDLIKEGYKKSSVYAVAKTIREEQLPGAGSPAAEAPVDDDLAALRRKKEIVKLEKEIADIESGKGTPLQLRVEALEEECIALRQDLRKAVDTALSVSANWVKRLALYQQYPIIGDWCTGWVEREIEEKSRPG